MMKGSLLRFSLLACVALLAGAAHGQDWFQLHVNYDGHEWAFPYKMDHISYFDFAADSSEVYGHRADDESLELPFVLREDGKTTEYDAMLDSLTFSSTLETWGKDKYKVFGLYITTDGGAAVDSKEEYVRCYVSVDGMGEYPDLSAPGKIRGRGNSTWKWYDKKPYRIKFDTSTKVLGIKKNKDWVLLANYRDVTKMMNTFCFVAAKMMGLPYTTPIRYAEVFLNGEYIGLYQIAEQVEQGGNRVDIAKDGGVLLAIDLDDGPGLSPDADDNFWSEVYELPICVKYPKDQTETQLDSIKDELAVLERAIKAHDYAALDTLMDIPSYIAMLQLQEYVYNVELSAPRSVFMFRDKGGKWTMGPAWDWDAAFDFSWADMRTGHTYFESYKETLFGSDPYNRNGDYKCPKFFTDMFCDATFMKQYKETWAGLADTLYTSAWAETQKYVDGLNELQTVKKASGGTKYSSPWQREQERWPISGFTPSKELTKMKTWLQNRLSYMTDLIASYPDETRVIDESKLTVVGTIEKSYELSFSSGYTQSVKVEVDKSEVAQLLGVDASELTTSTLSLVPLNTDGTEGTNTAAGTYGAWFDDDGNTVSYGSDSHVFIESDDLWTWSCGCHPYSCDGGDEHTVTMQYRYAASDGTAKAVNVVVTFEIDDDWGGWGW